MKVFQWLDFQTKERPFLCALISLVLVITPGFFRLETAVDKTNETASELVIFSKNQVDQLAETTLINCQTRNTASQNGRDRFIRFFNAIETIFTSSPARTPEQQEQVRMFMTELRKAVPLDPEEEDVDCNNNGLLDAEDYG